MNPEGTFSDAYWNMHRNALFFSLIALIFSLPGTNLASKMPTLGIGYIDSQSRAFIVLILLIAGLYATIIFTLEWRQQALPYLKKYSRSFSDNRQTDSENFLRISSSLERLEQHVSAISLEIAKEFEPCDDDTRDRPRLTTEKVYENSRLMAQLNEFRFNIAKSIELGGDPEYHVQPLFSKIISDIGAERDSQIDFAKQLQANHRISSLFADSKELIGNLKAIDTNFSPNKIG